MEHQATTVTRTTQNGHVIQTKNTTGEDQFRSHGTTTTGQRARVLGLTG